jgi:PKD repeat protein
MSNPFDNKIKESLENFEMPYDARAWGQMAEQLPPAIGTTTGGNQFGWKAVALVAIIATIAATIWQLTDNNEIVSENAVTIEQPTKEKALEKTNDEPSKIEDNKVSQESVITEKSQEIPEDEPVKNNTEISTMEESASRIHNSEISEPERVIESNSPVEQTDPIITKLDVPVIEDEPLVAKFLPSTFTICVGQDINFINESSDKSSNMTWDLGDGTIKYESDPVHNYVQPGNYVVSLIADNGSKTSDYSVNVTVNPTPRPIFSAQRKLNGYVAIPLYRFTTAIQPSETAIWSFSDGSRVKGNSAEHLFRGAGPGPSVAKLTVTNIFGCSSTMDETYDTQKEFDLLAPNTFSPNGDGINESFIPAAIPEMGIEFELSITNPKTGEAVYRTSNPSEPWNGKVNNVNSKLDAGVYIWTVVLKDNVVNDKVFNGKINLTR